MSEAMPRTGTYYRDLAEDHDRTDVLPAGAECSFIGMEDVSDGRSIG